MLQLKPSHAEGLNLKKLSGKKFISQPKYDGERILMHFDGDKVYMTSRRISKKTNKYVECQDNFSCFNTLRLPLGYTVIDGELYSKDWSTIVGMIHSLPKRSEELQKENKPRYACFDCLFYDGKDIRNLPYSKRLEYAWSVISYLKNRQLFLVNHIDLDIEGAKKWAIQQGGFEGVVVKLLDAKYDDRDFMFKNKKRETVDVVVYGLQEGTGKYKGMTGALKVGYYDKDKDQIVHVTNVNCGTDADRKWWWDNFKNLKNPVIEVLCQEVTKTSLRHPVYVRYRQDKDYTMCTKETIWK